MLYDQWFYRWFSDLRLVKKAKCRQMPSPWSLLNLPCFRPSHISLQPVSDYPPPTLAWQAEPSPPASPVPPPPFLLTPFHTMLAARAGQVAKPVSQSTVATRQYHRHQLPHSRGAAWQPHGNHMVQSGYTTTGTREGQEKWVSLCVFVFVCVCVWVCVCVCTFACVPVWVRRNHVQVIQNRASARLRVWQVVIVSF